MKKHISKIGLAALAVLLIFAVGCAEKKIVTKPTPEEKTVEAKPVEPAPKPVEEKKPDVEAEKIAEEQIAVTEKRAEAAPEVSAVAEKKFIAEAKAVCAPDPGGDIVFDGVYFDFDSYAISPASASKLKELSSHLSKNSVKVHIEGHADDRGTTEYNLALGEKRATAAKQYLASLGVASSRTEVVSCGEEQSKCDAQTEECWAQNRRARFVVIK